MKMRFFLGIKGKFVLTAALIVAISSIIWGTWAWRNEKRLLYDRLVSNARSMATSLRTPIINALVYEEMGVIEEGGLLDNFVEEIVSNSDFPTKYAFVTDDKGKVLAHNRYMEYGLTYTDDLTREALQGYSFLSRIVLDASTQEHILDIAVPLRIHGKSWGSLRIGISMKPLERELYLMGFKVISFSALFFLAGTMLFYFVGQTITRPIQKLAGAMSEINSKTLTVDLPEQPKITGAFCSFRYATTFVKLGKDPVIISFAPCFKARCNNFVPLVVVMTNILFSIKSLGYSEGELP